jgi:hypothetical protein
MNEFQDDKHASRSVKSTEYLYTQGDSFCGIPLIENIVMNPTQNSLARASEILDSDLSNMDSLNDVRGPDDWSATMYDDQGTQHRYNQSLNPISMKDNLWIYYC